MRTPNSECVVCKTPLYRRPSELARVRHVACMLHRAEAQKLSGITAAQQAGLARGRRNGTNHRKGYKHKESSRIKAALSNKRFWADNPDKLSARGAKTRGEKHCRWKGGVSVLNRSIRLMNENRRWMEAVKKRDGKCVRCGSCENLEAHHKKPLAELIKTLGITCRDDAREHAAELWNIEDGETLCEECHYKEHGRKHDNRRKYIQASA